MKKKRRILVVSLYLFFMLVFFEGFSRAVFLIPKLSVHPLVDDDLSWKRSWVNRQKYSGTEIYYTFDNYDATKGWSSKSNLENMKAFGDKILNTNAKGLRGKVDYSYDKSEGKIRILIVGDSFTFGDEVNDDETYSFLLQQLIPQAEIINFGVHGYGHDQMLIFLREEGVKYKPNIVILGFISGDMPRNLLHFRDYAKPRFVLENNKLVLTKSPVPPLEETLKWDWFRPRILDVASVLFFAVKWYSGIYAKDMENITTALLNELTNVVDDIGAKSIFVFLPYEDEISDASVPMPTEDYFFSMCENNDKVDCFSARPYFSEKMSEGMIFNKIGHWGAAGQRVSAEAIMRHLEKGGYVP